MIRSLRTFSGGFAPEPGGLPIRAFFFEGDIDR